MYRTNASRKGIATVATLAGVAVVLGCLAYLSTPAFAQGACATTTNLSLSTYTVQPGWPHNVSSIVRNCSDRKQRYTVERTFTSACGVTYPIAKSLISFKGGESKGMTSSWTIPAACTGQGFVTERVSSGSGVLASDTTTLTVQ